MPSKVAFRVIHVSGQDETYKASELNTHSPTTKGWQSSSYVALSDNEKTGYKARELKSVHVDAVGMFIKFVIHKNHINKHNLYNQDAPLVLDERLVADPSMAGVYNRPDYISPLDDLAFDMYQDPEVAQIIRKLETKKQEAVLQERYDFAKKVKAAIIDLQKVGEKLGKYEVEKRQAVENEDFDKAKLKKVQMDEYRLQIYKQLELHDMLEVSGQLRLPRPTPLVPARQPTPPRLESLEEPPPLPVHAGRSPPATPYDERPLPAIKKPTTPPDERPLPALTNRQVASEPERPSSARRDQTPLDADERPLPATQRDAAADVPADDGGAAVGEAENMTEKDQREASTAIDVFGYDLVKKAYSKTWSFREDALLEMLKVMQELPADTGRDEARVTYRAAVFMVVKALKDKVQAVYIAAINVLTYMLNEYVPLHKLGRPEVTYALERTIPVTLQRTGDTGARSRDTFKKLIIDLSSFAEVKPTHVVPHECVRPFKVTVAPRLGLSRTELVDELYRQHGLQNSGLNVENIMNFCTVAIKHNNGDVREKAERIIVALYKECGAPVKDYLPPDDQKTRKNVLYKLLFEAFDKIDGKPSKDELKKQRAAEEAAKQAEINKLEKQVQELRNLVPKDGAAKAKEPKEEPRKKKEPKKKAAPKKDLAPKESDVGLSAIDRKKADTASSTCIFCGEKSDAFTEEGLDLHYWKACPMLKRCAQCKQVVEISGLSEHLLKECESRAIFKQCPKCTEAVPQADYDGHIADQEHDKKYGVADPELSHCPMCHTNIPPGDDSWRTHLMTKDPTACRANPRRLPHLNKPADGKSKGSKKGGAKAASKSPKR